MNYAIIKIILALLVLLVALRVKHNRKKKIERDFLALPAGLSFMVESPFVPPHNVAVKEFRYLMWCVNNGITAAEIALKREHRWRMLQGIYLLTAQDMEELLALKENLRPLEAELVTSGKFRGMDVIVRLYAFAIAGAGRIIEIQLNGKVMKPWYLEIFAHQMYVACMSSWIGEQKVDDDLGLVVHSMRCSEERATA